MKNKEQSFVITHSKFKVFREYLFVPVCLLLFPHKTLPTERIYVGHKSIYTRLHFWISNSHFAFTDERTRSQKLKYTDCSALSRTHALPATCWADTNQCRQWVLVACKVNRYRIDVKLEKCDEHRVYLRKQFCFNYWYNKYQQILYYSGFL